MNGGGGRVAVFNVKKKYVSVSSILFGYLVSGCVGNNVHMLFCPCFFHPRDRENSKQIRDCFFVLFCFCIPQYCIPHL